MNVLLLLFLIQKGNVTKICTFHLLVFITMNILALVIFTNSSYLSKVKNFLRAWIHKMLIKWMLQHGRVLYWNYEILWIFIQTLAYQKFKIWVFVHHMFILSGGNIEQTNDITCLWVNTISMTENSHLILQKYIRL